MRDKSSARSAGWRGRSRRPEATAISVKSFCDGCSGECGDADLTTVGRYDPCVFCPDCLAKWRVYEAQERMAHAETVKQFEALWAALRSDLKAAGLARLPDEG